MVFAAILLAVTARGLEAMAGPVRVACDRPNTLRLQRFEDGSAQLRCATRILVRIGVPG